ncbi:hypothetical protein PRIPAC_80813 [Pristionchus pacificus]|uniref:Uncharacterized protein n=1 Tax=Pristionchus pacificus TaxID=54126 RepID=A0A2A6CPB7_PRIPA|nr:hypothetical protein PRIPAC_80813 [Pristionchus pacificus]|eukprot:PDM79979.1 hypothetical protein PRIPAC_32558 [Pristionchus pacificus]
MHIANVEAYELSEFIPDQFSKNDFGVMCLTRTTQVMQHRTSYQFHAARGQTRVQWKNSRNVLLTPAKLTPVKLNPAKTVRWTRVQASILVWSSGALNNVINAFVQGYHLHYTRVPVYASIFPLIDAFIIIFGVKSYRQTLLNIIRFRRGPGARTSISSLISSTGIVATTSML